MNIAIFLLQIILQVVVLRYVYKLGQVALGAFIVLEAVLANLFVLKQITLFGLSVTASDSFIIGSMIGLALYQEIFGKVAAKKLGLVTFGALFFITLTSMMHLWLIPSSCDTSQQHYHYILSQSPRLAIGSLGAFFLSSRADILLFNFLKKFSITLSFTKRAFISTIVTQAIDTVAFSIFALSGSIDNLFHIIIFSFIIKALCIILYLMIQPLLVKPQAA
jgi:queuosine precursor transporter